MLLDAHSFEWVHQKTSLSTDDFYNHPEKITDVHYTETLHEERVIAVREELILHPIENPDDCVRGQYGTFCVVQRRGAVHDKLHLSYSLNVNEFPDFYNQ